MREEAERLGAKRAELEQQRGRLTLLRGVQEDAIESRLATSRLKHLREILTLPDVSEIRLALMELIVRIEIGGDGEMSLLIGDGPMEPLPPGLEDLDGGGPLTSESTASPVSRSTPASHYPPGARPLGRRPGSRICVVGAPGFEPATS